jgi:hypothetical protein
MEISHTERGFSISKFKDAEGEDCSLQKSSSAMEDKIWLGVSHPKLIVFENEQMGKYIVADMPKNFDVYSRMHLNQEQVKQLLPYLIKFAETGELE